MWLSRLCHKFGSVFSATFTAPMGLIVISGYKMLYLCPLPIRRFPRMIIHIDSFRVILYPSSASMPMETRLLFNAGTCRDWCKVIVLPFGSWMGTSPVLAILHSCPWWLLVSWWHSHYDSKGFEPTTLFCTCQILNHCINIFICIVFRIWKSNIIGIFYSTLYSRMT